MSEARYSLSIGVVVPTLGVLSEMTSSITEKARRRVICNPIFSPASGGKIYATAEISINIVMGMLILNMK